MGMSFVVQWAALEHLQVDYSRLAARAHTSPTFSLWADRQRFAGSRVNR